MKTSRKSLLVLLLLSIGALVGGCSSHGNNQTIPWSRPAAWEGQIPGMGQPSGR